MIVVGVDGSEESKETLRFALEEARRWHTKLHVVHAFWEWEPIPATGEIEQDCGPQEREAWLAALVRDVVGEVAEHAPVEDYDKLNAGLAIVRDLGVRLAIDDAGAGFASLRHILRLQPDFIKLDGTLVAGIENDRSQQALAIGLISFAEKIGATIVAEGIEKESELSALRALGVEYGQGYFLGRPSDDLGLARAQTTA